METIEIKGRRYTVERSTDSRGEPCYFLTGARGARYGTMRNLSDPSQVSGRLYFLISLRGFGIPPGFEGVWLTDRTGKLEVRR